jgi:nicotinate-nucleotide pyrophosphorylase (carboxylating)
MKTAKLPWQLSQIDKQLIDLAFTEDLGLPYCDVTTRALFPDIKGVSNANIISKHPETIILAGLPVAEAILQKLDPSCELHTVHYDGASIAPGEVLATITGPAHILLMSERILLNTLQPLCAIATLTATFVKKISHTQTKILDTRKTLPGFRHLAKYAVQCGGGVNHRMGLYDAVMIKDTHVDLIGGMSAALRALPADISQRMPVIVEVRNQAELDVVLQEGKQRVTRVLLDNMSIKDMTACVALCRNNMPTEASGNVDLNNVAAIAETGVDFISIGKLTHSAGNVDLSMKSHISYA